MLQPALLAHYGKSNIRKLTKQESEEVELSKFVVLANLDPYTDISQDIILNILESSAKIKQEILVEVDNLIKEYMDKNSKSPSVEDMRQIYCLAYSYVKSALS